MKKFTGVIIVSILWAFQSYAWNAAGHKFSAKIAYDHLSLEAKQFLNNNLHVKGQADFLRAATWMDFVKSRGNKRYNALHYIDLPYAPDERKLPSVSLRNALSGFKEALAVLQSPESSKDEKSLQLKILIHVIADMHQPLHTINYINDTFPTGDLGGNLFRLGRNPLAKNLHQYWDRGGGFLLGKKKARQLNTLIRQLETKWSCDQVPLQSPEVWVKNSHELAIREAYTMKLGERPDKNYQLNTQYITEKQIAYAGCRLAEVINMLRLAHN